MNTQTIYLPWPPTLNNYYRNNQGRTHISPKGRAYRRAVVEAAAEQAVKPVAGRLAVHIEAFPPDRRVRDLDNLLKATLDALAKAGVYGDDGMIDRLLIERLGTEPGGLLRVTIEEVV